MVQKLFKMLLVALLVVPLQVSASKKAKKVCLLAVKTLLVCGNETINGNLTIGGTLTVNGVDFNSLAGIAGAIGAVGPQGIQGIAGVLGAIGAAGPAGAQGIAGALGAIGAAGPAGAAGIAGAIGAIGETGATGIPGVPGVVGAAEFIRTIQSPNNSVPPGTAFTIDTEVVNNAPAAIIASAGAGGTVYTLAAGTYVIDYEMSLGAAGSVGIYKGPTSASLALDPNTVAGSTTATTWIHGRAIEVVPTATTVVFAISSVVGTANVVTAGTAAGSFMIRLTILKIA